MERVPLMVTFHLTCEYRIQTNKQKILFTYLKPKYSDLSTRPTVALQISKEMLFKAGKNNRVENNENVST